MHAYARLLVQGLDGAKDQLLTQTFDDPLGQILEVLPKSRQTLFFSATVTQCIEKLKKGKELTLIDANPNEESLETLTQLPPRLLVDFEICVLFKPLFSRNMSIPPAREHCYRLYVFVPKSVQINYLHYLLQKHFPEESCIVFAASLDECQLLTTMLDILGFEAPLHFYFSRHLSRSHSRRKLPEPPHGFRTRQVTGLHSLQSQRQRLASLGKFRASRAKILVATDVAGRGLDIPSVAVAP